MTPPLIMRGRGVNLRLRLGDGPATPSGGIGGWSEVTRPRDTPLTDFDGRPLVRQAIPVMLDGWADGETVERRVNRVKRVGLGNPPPFFRCSGPIHYPSLRWVLESIDFGDAIRRRDGVLVRQALTLNLVEYQPPDQIRIGRRKKRGHRSINGVGTTEGTYVPRTYVTHKGDNLHKVSQVVFGTPKYWKQIGQVNSLKDPTKVIKTGTKLKIPAGLV